MTFEKYLLLHYSMPVSNSLLFVCCYVLVVLKLPSSSSHGLHWMFFILSARFAQRLVSITTDYKMIETSVFTIILSKWVFTVIQIYAQWILMIFMYCPSYGNVVYKRYHLQYLRKMCMRRALASAVLWFFCHKPFWETVVSCLNEGPIAPSFFGM